MRPPHDRPSAALRSTFIAARLLEALGRMQEAETLFDEVVTGDLREGLHKDALLDLVYIFGFHVRLGAPERAAEVSVRTLHEIDRHDSVVHEQLRSSLRSSSRPRRRSLDERMLQQVDEYLRSHWNIPRLRTGLAPEGRVPASSSSRSAHGRQTTR